MSGGRFKKLLKFNSNLVAIMNLEGFLRVFMVVSIEPDRARWAASLLAKIFRNPSKIPLGSKI